MPRGRRSEDIRTIPKGCKTMTKTQAPMTAPWVRELVSRWDVDALAARIVERDMAVVFSDRAADPRFSEMLRTSVTSNLGFLSGCLAGRQDLADVALQAQVTFAREQAHLGSSQNALQRSYRLGLRTIAADWLALVAREAVRLDLRIEEAMSAVTDSTALLLRFADVVLTQVATEFAEQEARLRLTGQQIKQQVVWDILTSNGSAETSELLLVLGYDLTGSHLAVEVAGTKPADSSSIVAALRKAGSSSHHLVLNRRVDHLTLWLYKPRTWEPDAQRAVLATLREMGRAAVVSRPASGIPGLQQSYQQLVEMEPLFNPRAGSRAQPVNSYDDVQLDLLLLRDPAAAARFVADTLGELADETNAAAKLRETLLTSFTYGSHVQTAEQLGLHEHTVRNRIQRAEQILGGRLARRRVEVETALRLHATLGPAVPPR